MAAFPGMERLGHGAERLLEAGGLRARDAEGMREPAGVEAEELPGRGRGAEVTEEAGHVPAPVGELPPDDASDARLHLEAGDEGGEDGGAARVPPLAQGERHRRHRRGPVDDRRQVRVVEIQRVRLRAVGERGVQRAGAPAPAHDRRLRLAAHRRDHRPDRVGQRLRRAADGGAEPVGQGPRGRLHHGRGQRRRLEAEHEVHQLVHHRGRGAVVHGLSHSCARAEACTLFTPRAPRRR